MKKESGGSVLDIFDRCGESFPAVAKARAVQKNMQMQRKRQSLMAMGNVMKTQPEEEETKVGLEVIWAEEIREGTVKIICELTAPQEGIVAVYSMKVVDDKEKEIARSEFVSFNRNTAFAAAEISKKIFAKCSVLLETAKIGRGIQQVSCRKSLEKYDTKAVEVKYNVTAPVKKTAGDCIKIAYYSTSSKNYDYVYPGRTEHQFYMPSVGEITIPGMKLMGASLALRISEAGGTEVNCNDEPKLEVKGDKITYSYQEKWTDVALWDVFKIPWGNRNVDYTLQIMAEREEDDRTRVVLLLITNVKKIKELLDDSIYHDSVHFIAPIVADLDCLAEGTVIRMADGGSKAVEELVPGDLVRTQDGKSTAVSRAEEQGNCQVLELVLEDESRIRLTEGHAVYTQDNVYPASKLKEGQMLLTEGGPKKLKEIVRCCEAVCKVYSLFLEDGEARVFADGIMVHSSESDGLFRDRDWVREELPKEWLEDYDSAMRAGIMYDG